MTGCCSGISRRESNGIHALEGYFDMAERKIVNDAILKDIAEKVHGIELGTITISVYDSRIVQVDITTTEKRRFDDVWLVENGGGI